MTDQELLRQYVEGHSQQAFAELVDRHKDWLYSTCMRRLQNAHMAEDAAQATLITLARKARSLLNHVSLAGWLYQTACFTVADAQKRARRRAKYEMEAVMRQTLTAAQSNDATWERIAPFLEPALDRLPQKHRLPILLRFYERKTHPQIAEALGISEDAAKKRLERALDLLRSTLQARRVVFPAAALMTLLLANTVQAAPATLTASATLATLAAGTGATWTLSQGALHMIFWSQAKAAVMIVSVAGGVTVGSVAVNHVIVMAQRQPVVVAQAWDAASPAVPTGTVNGVALPAPAPPAAPKEAQAAVPASAPPAAQAVPENAANEPPTTAPATAPNTGTGTFTINFSTTATNPTAQGNAAVPANNFIPAQGGVMMLGTINVVAGTGTLTMTGTDPVNEPLTALGGFDKSLAELDGAKAAAALYAENQDEKDYVGAYEQLVKSVSQVKAALAEQKLAGTAVDAILQTRLSPLPFSHADVNGADIAEDNTRATVRPNGQQQPLTMVHQEDAWKIPVKPLFARDALIPATATAKQTTQNLEALAGDIRAGKIRTLSEFQDAYKKAWATP